MDFVMAELLENLKEDVMDANLVLVMVHLLVKLMERNLA